MAEPESAVLPITPYPIGGLKQLVKGFRRLCDGHAAAAASCPRADVQTTKQFGRFSPAPDLVASIAQPLETALASKQLH
jgi:hypothetical protein